MHRGFRDSAEKSGPADAPPAADSRTITLDALADAISRLVGMWLTRPPSGGRNDAPQEAELSRMMVVRAVDMGEPGQPATLGEVAARLRVDPAEASRTVADAVHAGYIRRIVGSCGDSRLALTEVGTEVIQAIRHQHRVGLVYLTHDWAEEERDLFARLMTRFVEAADQQPES